MRFFCGIAILEVCDVLLREPYMWKNHVVYDFRCHTTVIYLGCKFYIIPEVASLTTISLISTKQCTKIIS